MGDRIDFPVSKSALTKRKACKECGKPIVFVRNDKTKRWMALDCESAIPHGTPDWFRLEDHHPHCPNWNGGKQKVAPKTPAPADPQPPKRERAMTQAEEERRDLYGHQT